MADAQTLGKYELLARLGRGRNCEVFLAVRRGSVRRRIVALKRLRNRSEAGPEANAALLREAELAAMIKHAKVVDVYEYGEEDGICYIAMEYLAGQPLGALIRKAGALPQPCVARIGADIADGLHAAHRLRGDDGARLNLVHLDVSPSNIQVTYEGRVLLVDFGLARAVGSEPTTRGKIGYLAPEQIARLEPDARTDVFALGVVLWEAVTGKRLFRCESREETRRAISETDAPRASSVTTVDESLDDIIAKALARDRDARYESAAALAKALRAYLATCDIADTVAAISELMLESFADERETSEEAVANALKVLAGEQSGPRLARALSEPLAEDEALPNASADADSEEYYYYDDDDKAASTPAADKADATGGATSDESDEAGAAGDESDESDESDEPAPATATAAQVATAVSASGAAAKPGTSKGDADELEPLGDDDDLVVPGGISTVWIIAAAAVLIIGIGTVVALSGGGDDKKTSAAASDTSETASGASAGKTADGPDSPAPVASRVEPVGATADGGVLDTADPRRDAAVADDEAARLAAEEAERDKAAAAEREAAEAAAAAEREKVTEKAAEKAAKAAAATKADEGEPEKPKKDKKKGRAAYKAASRLLVTGDAAGAIRKYRKALDAWPGYPPAYRGLGLASERQGKTKKAIRYYKRYLRAAPRAKDAASIRQRIQRLGG